jgi:hypothetical protein
VRSPRCACVYPTPLFFPTFLLFPLVCNIPFMSLLFVHPAVIPLGDRGARVRFHIGSRMSTSPYRLDRLWPASYPMGTGVSFPRG